MCLLLRLLLRRLLLRRRLLLLLLLLLLRHRLLLLPRMLLLPVHDGLRGTLSAVVRAPRTSPAPRAAASASATEASIHLWLALESRAKTDARTKTMKTGASRGCAPASPSKAPRRKHGRRWSTPKLMVAVGFIVFCTVFVILLTWLPDTPPRPLRRLRFATKVARARLGRAAATVADKARVATGRELAPEEKHVHSSELLHNKARVAPKRPTASASPAASERGAADAAELTRAAKGRFAAAAASDAAQQAQRSGTAAARLAASPAPSPPHGRLPSGSGLAAKDIRPCIDQDSHCAQWAKSGECKANPGYMLSACPQACDACETFFKKQTQCHRGEETKPLLRPGGLSVDATFERLLRLLGPTHTLEVLSRPPRGPWIVTIEDFLQEHEVRALTEKGGHHFERSLAGDGVSPVRTSKTSWCNIPFCESDPTVASVRSRIANVTGVPVSHSEHVQVLHYDPGDFYRQHHDQNAHPRSPWGPRLFTFFLYLNDVERGGGTRFVHLNMTVEAKRGRALMWPSVLDKDPSAIRNHEDSRTTHEALAVEAGIKRAANVWLHQYDFQSKLAAGCRNEDHALCGDCGTGPTGAAHPALEPHGPKRRM